MAYRCIQGITWWDTAGGPADWVHGRASGLGEDPGENDGGRQKSELRQALHLILGQGYRTTGKHCSDEQVCCTYIYIYICV